MFAETEIEVETQVQLIEISEEESLILEKVNEYQNTIEQLALEQEGIEVSIEETDRFIDETEKSILALETSYQNKVDILKEVLILYQKKGSSGFLETLLDSESIGDFLKRLDVIRDLSRNTDKLLVDIEEEKVQVVLLQKELEGEKTALEAKKQQLVQAIDEKEKAVKEREDYLVSLQDERGKIEELLAEIQIAWDEALLVFAQTSSEFDTLLNEGAFPEEALELELTLSGIEAGIKESVFNQVLQDHEILDRMVFQFEKDEVTMKMESISLELVGNFEVYDDFAVIYRPTGGSFYGLALREDSLRELSAASELVLNLESILVESQLSEVRSEKDRLILKIAYSLF